MSNTDPLNLEYRKSEGFQNLVKVYGLQVHDFTKETAKSDTPAGA